MTKTKFRQIGSDYEAGDERAYEVIERGYIVGIVERDYLLSDTEGGEGKLGWTASLKNGRTGTGATRAQAVADAKAAADPETTPAPTPEPETVDTKHGRIQYLDSDHRYFRFV